MIKVGCRIVCWRAPIRTSYTHTHTQPMSGCERPLWIIFKAFSLTRTCTDTDTPSHLSSFADTPCFLFVAAPSVLLLPLVIPKNYSASSCQQGRGGGQVVEVSREERKPLANGSRVPQRWALLVSLFSRAWGLLRAPLLQLPWRGSLSMLGLWSWVPLGQEISLQKTAWHTISESACDPASSPCLALHSLQGGELRARAGVSSFCGDEAVNAHTIIHGRALHSSSQRGQGGEGIQRLSNAYHRSHAFQRSSF